LPLFQLALIAFLAVQSLHSRLQENNFDPAVCLKSQITGKDGLVQLGLMWRCVEPGFGVGTGRHINP